MVDYIIKRILKEAIVEKEKNNFIKEHTDTIAIILSVFLSMLGGVMWINGELNDLKRDMAIIKTVLVMKNIMPDTLAKCDKEKNEK